MTEIRLPNSTEDIETFRALIEEYAALVGEALCGMQEFASQDWPFPSAFSPPHGEYLLAFCDGMPAGCVAFRHVDGSTCEMKRLFVRPIYHGLGIGRALIEAIMDSALLAGYRRIRLDTHVSMESAVRLYECFGFEDVPPFKPYFDGARFMARDL